MSSELPRLKFYLDENFPVPAGEFLKSLRQNVKYVISDQSARQKSDSWQIKQATKTGRVFLALDKDFQHQQYAELVKKSLGILLIRSASPHHDKINRILRKLITGKQLTEKKISGKVCIASTDKVRYIKPTY